MSYLSGGTRRWGDQFTEAQRQYLCQLCEDADSQNDEGRAMPTFVALAKMMSKYFFPESLSTNMFGHEEIYEEIRSNSSYYGRYYSQSYLTEYARLAR